MGEIDLGAELSWHFFFACCFFGSGLGSLFFSLFFQQCSSIFQLFSLVFQRFPPFSIVLSDFLARSISFPWFSNIF